MTVIVLVVLLVLIPHLSRLTVNSTTPSCVHLIFARSLRSRGNCMDARILRGQRFDINFGVSFFALVTTMVLY